MDKKNIYDTWVLTDALGRSTSTVPKPNGREVGMFYFLWHDADNGPIYDHNKAYNEGGLDAVWEMMQEGRLGYAHYWGEPHFGYYRADDEWIIRKHCHMLSAAGIDFIFFDCSNGHFFPKTTPLVFETYQKIASEGIKVPKIVFFNGDRPDLNYKTIMGEWELIYKKGLYKDLWYMVDGKPLMLCNPEDVHDPEILNFFTIRRSWAFSPWDWYQETEGKNCWPWIDWTPQQPGKSPTGEVEQVIVSCGFHANGSNGRSFSNGKQRTDSGEDFGFGMTNTVSPLGLAFEEQFNRAMEIKAPVMMVTGWNEWWAGRWEGPAAQGQRICSTYTVDINSPENRFTQHYVDNFSPEYSRDLEPMKGGFTDNYYCQLVDYVRKYKGFNSLPLSNKNATINIDNLNDWESIEPAFHDTVGDTMHRSAPSFGGVYHYDNNTGRNDLDYGKVARDDNYLYFLMTTQNDLTSPEGENWMNLYLDVNPTKRVGWEGYSYLINRRRKDGKATIEFTKGGWNWEEVGEADIKIFKNSVVVKLPLKLINLTAPYTFDFKWADNSTLDGNVMDFYDKGDTAPDDRFNFRYKEVE